MILLPRRGRGSCIKQCATLSATPLVTKTTAISICLQPQQSAVLHRVTRHKSEVSSKSDSIRVEVAWRKDEETQRKTDRLAHLSGSYTVPVTEVKAVGLPATSEVFSAVLTGRCFSPPYRRKWNEMRSTAVPREKKWQK